MQLRIMRLLVCAVDYLAMFAGNAEVSVVAGDVGDAKVSVVIEKSSPTPEEELDTKPSY